jgi:DNA helicase II / ATP-dependent DNA helicase PcrA
MSLTIKQEEIVKEVRGHFVVLAGPGCGKTHTITEKICYIFENEKISEPYRLLALTFTDYAARIMRSYLRKKGFSHWDRVYIGTFHSFGSYLLRSFGREIGLREDFKIIESKERDKILKELVKNNGLRITARDLGDLFERVKRGEVTLERRDIDAVKEFVTAYESYNQILRENNFLDFGDLIYNANLLLNQSDFAKRLITKTYCYIVVDEFQDTDKQQLLLVKEIAKTALGSTIVGDDDQSIFSWRGANRDNLINIKEILGSEERILGENFRSNEVILEAARKIIGCDPNRKEKNITCVSTESGNLYRCEFNDVFHEAKIICNIMKDITRKGGVKNLGDISLIARVRYRTDQAKEEFDRRGLPWFDRSDLTFLDSWETAIGLATLRLAHDTSSSEFLYQLMSRIEEAGLAHRLKEIDSLDVAIHIRDNLRNSGIDDLRIQNVQNILSIAGIFKIIQIVSSGESENQQKISNLMKMIQDLDKISAIHEIDLFDTIKRISGFDAIQIISGHQSKGGEFDIVFFIGLEDDILPSYHSHNDDNQIAEERRIFYVGITRAKKSAYLTYATTRPTLYGGIRKTEKSRFIDYIPSEFFTPLNY